MFQGQLKSGPFIFSMLHQVRTNLMQDFLGEHWAWGFLQCTRLKFKYEAQLFGQESWTSLFWTAVTHSASPTHESEIPAQLMSGMWNCLAGSDQFRILWDLQVEGLFFPFFFFSTLLTHIIPSTCRFESLSTIHTADPVNLLQMVTFLPCAKDRYFWAPGNR